MAADARATEAYAEGARGDGFPRRKADPAGARETGRGRRSIRIMRFGTLPQRLVMNERRLGPERNRLPAAESPFAPVAIAGAHIAVDVEAAAVSRSVRAGTVDQIGAPEREVARLQQQVDSVGGGEARRLQQRIVHRPAQHIRRPLEIEMAGRMASRNETPPPRPGVLPNAREAGLHIGGAEVAERMGGPAKA